MEEKTNGSGSLIGIVILAAIIGGMVYANRNSETLEPTPEANGGLKNEYKISIGEIAKRFHFPAALDMASQTAQISGERIPDGMGSPPGDRPVFNVAAERKDQPQRRRHPVIE